ncbi:MAG: hypothetical protein QXJ06_03115 [Candidatus Aenigmatarchaeota archaeon]
MNWKIQIEGDKKYLEDLNGVFGTLNLDPKIIKEGENYYLEGTIFEDSSDPEKVSLIAKTLLTLLPVVFNFKTKRAIELPKVVVISYEDENFKYTYDPERKHLNKTSKSGKVIICEPGSFNIKGEQVDFLRKSKDGKILGGLNTIESIMDYLKTHTDSESLKNVVEYLKPSLEILVNFSLKFSGETPTKEIVGAEIRYGKDFELAKWAALRKIYETIRDDDYFKDTNFHDGFSFICRAIGKESADNFYCTVTKRYIHPKTTTRNHNSNSCKEYRVINLSEAEELISKLLSKYIEEKAKEIKNNRGES